MEMVHGHMRPLLLQLGNFRSLTLNVIKVLSSLTQLFPNTFNEKLCEKLLSHLKKWVELAITIQKSGQVRITGQVVSNVSTVVHLARYVADEYGGWVEIVK